MNRVLPFALLLLGAGLAIWLLRDENAPPPPPTAPSTATESEVTPAEPGRTETAAVVRHQVDAAAGRNQRFGSRYLAALGGYRGRLLDADLQPAAGVPIKLLLEPSGALHRIPSPFAAEPEVSIDLVAGSTVTDAEGYFELLAIPRRAPVLLQANGEQPTWRIVRRLPTPGEIIDLGDIVTESLGRIRGKVVGPDGQPLAGVSVRAVDALDGHVSRLGLERIDPQGAVIMALSNSRVFLPEPWLVGAFADLPIPQAISDEAGEFELRGVRPGNNTVALRQAELLPVTTSVEISDPGAIRDLGTLQLLSGEKVTGKVTDSRGEPIPEAQVIVASHRPDSFYQFASFTADTDQQGHFEYGGLPEGKAIVAARRSVEGPWVISDPQDVDEPFELVMPSSHRVTLSVRDAGGRPVPNPELRLLRHGEQIEVMEEAIAGNDVVVPSQGSRRIDDDGAVILDDLPAGHYALLCRAEGHAAGYRSFELTADQEIELRLERSRDFTVRVLDPSGAPLADAAIELAELRDNAERPTLVRLYAGHSGATGQLRIQDPLAARLEVVALHPEFDRVEGKVTLPVSGAVTLQFAMPGTIEGQLTTKDGPANAGEWTIALSRREERFSTTVAATLNEADGKFRFTALAPGPWAVFALPAPKQARSPGELLQGMLSREFGFGFDSKEVDLAAGETKFVELGKREAATGPSARFRGTAFVDGRPAAGYRVQGMAWTETFDTNSGRSSSSSGESFDVEVDAQGRFDLGELSGDYAILTLEYPADPAGEHGRRSSETWGKPELWRSRIDIEQGMHQDLVIDVQTSSLQGVVLGPDGQPAADLEVGVQVLEEPDSNGRYLSRSTYGRVRTDSSGRFELTAIPVGAYALTVHEPGLRGRISPIEVQAGAPALDLQLQLHRVYTISGRVDLSALAGGDRERRLWMYLTHQPAEGPAISHQVRVRSDGRFHGTAMAAGSYQVSIHVEPRRPKYNDPNPIEVRADVQDLLIRPVLIPRPEQPAATQDG